MINRPFFRPQKSQVSEPTLNPPDIDALRQQILRIILIGSSVLAVVAIVPGVAQRLRQGDLVMASILLGAFVSVLVLTAFNKIPYRIRAIGFLLMVALLGLSTLAADGVYGNSRIFLIALPVLASLLLGGWAGFISIVLSLVVLIVTALMMLTGQFPPPVFGPEEGHASLAYWLVALTTFAMVGMAMVLPLYSLLNGLVSSLTQTKQLAGTLDLERSQLEHKIIKRTQELERRLIQLRTAAEISRSITVSFSRDIYSQGAMAASPLQVDEESQGADTLLQRVVDLVRERFDLYYVGVFLLDESRRQAILRAGTGAPGRIMLSTYHHLAVDDNSMIGWSINHRQARIALDVAPSATPPEIAERRKQGAITITRFKNPLLPKTRSELALPMMSGDTPIGAMTVQSELPRAFDQDDIMVLQSIADTLTAALENTRLFQQAQQNLREIRALNRLYFVESWKAAADLPEFKQVEYLNVEKIPETEETESLSDIRSDSVIQNDQTASITFPISLRDQVIGSLVVERDAPLTSEEHVMLEAIANETALALENVRLLEETHRRASQERLVSNLARQVRSTTDIDSILSITVRELGQALSSSSAVIRLDSSEHETTFSPPDRMRPSDELSTVGEEQI